MIADGFAGQGFQVAGGEIFFAELDVVDAGAGGFGDFFQEAATAGGFVAGECGAVGDVVEEAAAGISSQSNAANQIATSAKMPSCATTDS